MFRQKPRRRKPVEANKSSASVFSYHSLNQSPPQPTKLKRSTSALPKVRKINWKQLPSFLAIIAIGVSFLYVLTLSTTPRIQTASLQEPQFAREQAAYQMKAQEIMNGSFMNKFKFTINTAGIEQQMKASFPELEQVTLLIPLVGHEPTLQLKVAAPSLILENDNGKFIIDGSGTAIMNASDAGDFGSAGLPVIKDESGLDVTIGKGVLTDVEVAYIRTVASELQRNKHTVEAITLPAQPNELRLKLKNKPYTVRFNFLADARQSVGTFLAVNKDLESKRIVPASTVDVRVEGRAYYK